MKASVDETQTYEELFGDDEYLQEATAEEAVEKQKPAATNEPAKGKHLVFDIETGPEDDETLRKFFEVDLDRVKDRHLVNLEFDPLSVKLGNLKDQAKINAKIEAKAQEFAAAKAAAVDALAAAETDQWAEFVGRAALSPVTGRVLAIGYADEGDSREYAIDIDTDEGGEDVLLAGFWERWEELSGADYLLIGFNSHGFDLPFLVRRSWLLGVDVPGDVIRDGRFWHRSLVDLMGVWQCGDRSARISLDRLHKFFGGEGKTEGISGGDFSRLYLDEDTRKLAIEYLTQDLRCTIDVAIRMGVI